MIVGIDLDTVAPTIELSASPASVFPPNGKARTVTIEIDAADDSGGEVDVEFVSATAAGNKKAAVTQLTDTTFSVTAAVGAVYTFTYTATDAAGNTASATTEVRVQR